MDNEKNPAAVAARPPKQPPRQLLKAAVPLQPTLKVQPAAATKTAPLRNTRPC